MQIQKSELHFFAHHSTTAPYMIVKNDSYINDADDNTSNNQKSRGDERTYYERKSAETY